MEENKASNALPLTRKDFLSQSEPRWCLGCGIYATFNALVRAFLSSGVAREKFAVISGIGCSSRLPYYLNTFGFHTLHGRAPTVALGLKMVQPDLNVWVVTGDGDALSIGGNHFLHLMRRNPNIKMVLFNNQIYGLTKGQASPTSPLGKTTKSSPLGTVDRPIHPLTAAIGAGATFVARVLDTDNEMLFEVMRAAEKHKGTAIIEVLINCIIFNDGAFEALSSKNTRADRTLLLQAGKPLLFGENQNRGIRFSSGRPEIVTVGEGGVKSEDLVIHDPEHSSASYAFMLAEMGSKESGNIEMPVPLGILRQVEETVFHPHESKGSVDELNSILKGTRSWQKV